MEQVELYGAKEAKKMPLSEVISDEAILERFSKVRSPSKSENVEKNGGVDPNAEFRKVDYRIGGEAVDEERGRFRNLWSLG